MIAYLDLPAGLSGDIFLGCLVAAGWDIARLRAVVEALNLSADEWSIDSRLVMKGAIQATLVDVHAKEGHVHRGLADITAIIHAAALPEPVKTRAIAVFTRLAQAEARVHGTTVDKIHFHEVGAVDAIIDIVGTVAGLHDLRIQQLYASPVPLGSGWTKSAHGQIPLPAPATLELLAQAHAPTHHGPGVGELTTPTAAALLAEFAVFQQPPMTLHKIALGAGQRDCPWPNIARLWLGEPLPAAGGAGASGGLVQLETNIDDMNPQLFPGVSDKLFAAGAKDVWFTPIHMKKGRPAVMLSALGPAGNQDALANTILQETTTLGVRVHALAHRPEAQREMHTAATPYGYVAVKVKYLDGRPLGAMPEFEECKTLADQAGVPIRIVWEAATAAAQGLLKELQAR